MAAVYRPWLVCARLDLGFLQPRLWASVQPCTHAHLSSAIAPDNCSCIVLPSPIHGLVPSPIHGLVPPASLQSCASIRNTAAIYGLEQYLKFDNSGVDCEKTFAVSFTE